MVARRDTREKHRVPMDGLAGAVHGLLDDIQLTLFERALAFRDEHTQRVGDYEAFKQAMEGRPGFVIAPWCGSADCEAQIKTETQATIRNMPMDSAVPTGHCVRCDNPAQARGVVREGVLGLEGQERQEGRSRTGGQRFRSRSSSTLGQRASIRFIAAWRRVSPSRLTMARNTSATCWRHQSPPLRLCCAWTASPRVRGGQWFQARTIANLRQRRQKIHGQRR